MGEKLQLICLGCMEPITDEEYINKYFGYIYHVGCEHLHHYMFSTHENSPTIEGEEEPK